MEVVQNPTVKPEETIRKKSTMVVKTVPAYLIPAVKKLKEEKAK